MFSVYTPDGLMRHRGPEHLTAWGTSLKMRATRATFNVGAFIFRVGFCGRLDYSHNEVPQNGTGKHSGPYVSQESQRWQPALQPKSQALAPDADAIVRERLVESQKANRGHVGSNPSILHELTMPPEFLEHCRFILSVLLDAAAQSQDPIGQLPKSGSLLRFPNIVRHPSERGS